jgi:hypothetical protein
MIANTDSGNKETELQDEMFQDQDQGKDPSGNESEDLAPSDYAARKKAERAKNAARKKAEKQAEVGHRSHGS